MPPRRRHAVPEHRLAVAATLASGQVQMAEAMMEATLQEHVRVRCRDVFKRVLYYHTHRSKYSPSGYPDTTLVGPESMAYAELKRCTDEPTPSQQKWIDALRQVGQTVYVWTPYDLFSGEIDRVLTDLNGPPTARH